MVNGEFEICRKPQNTGRPKLKKVSANLSRLPKKLELKQKSSSTSNDLLEIIDEIHFGDNLISTPQPTVHSDSPIRLTLTEALLLAGDLLSDYLQSGCHQLFLVNQYLSLFTRFQNPLCNILHYILRDRIHTCLFVVIRIFLL